MKLWQKFAVGSTALISATVLAACGSSNSDSSSTSSKGGVSGSVKLWVDNTQVSSYKAIVKDFNKKYPDVKVKVTQSPNGSSNAKTDVAKDPAKAADVFEVPNDQLGQMASAGYINPLSPDATKTVKKNNVASAVKGVTWKNKLYAFPFAMQAQTLYYNKAKFSDEDVKDWDTMTSKGVVATDFTVPYNVYPIFLSAGTEMYGKSGEDLKGTNVNTQAGVNAMTWYAAQKHNKGVMQTSNVLNQLKSGKAGAILDGPWDAVNIRKLLGKNFGVAPYPTVTIGGKKVQMQAFLGIETFAVNSNTPTKSQKAAATLAEFITNKESQLRIYKDQGQIPVDKAAEASDTFTKDPVAVAVKTMAQSSHSTLMPKMPQMATLWDQAAPLINGAYSGSIKPADYMTKLTAFHNAVSKKN
ncbi:extracellular solute-binding protein [Lacticaseibacillus jixianensis]|uniref:Extracellular solute-binding protein n=1 Tax=Lacticaseibacillus jixianensis TaxID=2486012 RepID=A0ABW4B7C1_9LACO|nr:extracellular solute-binding protein [Lacticaseibacillus jixianensis]